MRKFFCSLLAFLALTSFSMADVPAIGYYIIKTEDLLKVLPENGELGGIKENVLGDLALAKGYFMNGWVNSEIKTKELKIFFYVGSGEIPHSLRSKKDDSDEDKNSTPYALRIVSLKDDKEVYTGNGYVKTNGASNKDWRKSEYTVIFKGLNLKK